MKLIIFSIFLVVLSSASAHCEEIFTRSTGEKIVIYDDGTWKKYVDNENIVLKSEESCSEYVEVMNDKFSGRSFTAAKKQIIFGDGDKKIGIGLLKSQDNSRSILVKVFSSKRCVDKNSKAYFLFKDGVVKEFTSSAKFNCDGNINIFLSSGSDFTEKLKSDQVSSVRATTVNGLIDVDLDETSSKILLETAKCLY